jgi:hypothetical protein
MQEWLRVNLVERRTTSASTSPGRGITPDDSNP